MYTNGETTYVYSDTCTGGTVLVAPTNPYYMDHGIALTSVSRHFRS
jgi:hypothetical protein